MSSLDDCCWVWIFTCININHMFKDFCFRRQFLTFQAVFDEFVGSSSIFVLLLGVKLFFRVAQCAPISHKVKKILVL